MGVFLEVEEVVFSGYDVFYSCDGEDSQVHYELHCIFEDFLLIRRVVVLRLFQLIERFLKFYKAILSGLNTFYANLDEGFIFSKASNFVV